MGRRAIVREDGKERHQLLPKERKFLDLLINEGFSKAEAYRKAFGKKKPSTFDTGAANRLLQRPAVLAELERLRNLSRLELLMATPRAVRKLTSLMSEAKSEVVQLRAAKAVIEKSLEQSPRRATIFAILSGSQIADVIREAILEATKQISQAEETSYDVSDYEVVSSVSDS